MTTYDSVLIVNLVTCSSVTYLSEAGVHLHLTDSHRFSQILTDSHRFSQILTDSHRFSQILTDSHSEISKPFWKRLA